MIRSHDHESHAVLSGRPIDGAWGGITYRTGTFTLGTSGRAYYWPFWVPRSFTPAFVSTSMAATIFGGTMKVAWYASKLSRLDEHYPGALLWTPASATFDLTTGGEQQITWAGGLVERGWYWLAICPSDNGAATHRTLRRYAGNRYGWTATSSTNGLMYLYEGATTYANFPASPAPTSFSVDTGLYVPLVTLEP